MCAIYEVLMRRRPVRWVRWIFYAEVVVIGVFLLCFICLLQGGSDVWREIARFCFGFGAFGLVLLLLAQLVGLQMVEEPPDTK